MRYLKLFEGFINENDSWPGDFKNTPEWKLLTLMGWENTGIRNTSIEIYNPKNGRYSLTKAGYVRTPGSMRTGGRGNNLKELFAYIINRFKKKDLPEIPMIEIENLFKSNPELMNYLWDMDKMKSQLMKSTGLPDTKGDEIRKMGLSVIQVKYLDRLVKKSGGSWRFNEKNGRIDIEGSVSSTGLKGFRGIKFGVVEGSFDCSDNNLNTLEDGPTKVYGNFDCSGNNLINLKGSPKIVKGGFYCSNNPNLNDLEGAPEIVEGNFSCSNNPNLKDLKGAPLKVLKDFDCSKTGISSLAGISQDIGWNLICKENPNLRDLKGAPIKINGFFDCSSSGITSLEGSPETVGSISCGETDIITMKGCPKNIGSVSGSRVNIYECDNLISLEGITDGIENLSIVRCKNLKSLDPLKKVGIISIEGCDSLVDLSSLEVCEKFTFVIPGLPPYPNGLKTIPWDVEGWLYGVSVYPKMFTSLLKDPNIIVPILQNSTKDLIEVYPYLSQEIKDRIENEAGIDPESVKKLKDLGDLGFF